MGTQRRDYNKTPPIDDVDAYATQWWMWWQSVQPRWRTVQHDGSLLRAGTKTTEDWEDLHVAGPRGFMLVLLSLFWWKKSVNVTGKEWADSVSDVLWVLTSLIAAGVQNGSDTDMGSETTTRKPLRSGKSRREPSEPQASERRSKRLRH